MSERREAVRQALATVIEPELNRDIISLDMVKDLQIKGPVARFTIVLTTPACPLKDVFIERCNAAVLGRVPGIERLDIRWDAQVPEGPAHSRASGCADAQHHRSGEWQGRRGQDDYRDERGCSAGRGRRTGRADGCGHSQPEHSGMTGLGYGRPRVIDQKMQPLEAWGVKIISTGFLTPPDKPMIMRGPMLHSAIRQFFTDVNWGRLDYMIVDLPPGTGDAPLSLAQSFPLTGAVIVTQPQDVAVTDALRSAAMFETLEVPVLGVVENMSGEFFGSGGGEALAEQRALTFLGRVPLAAAVREGGDFGRPLVISSPESPAGHALMAVAQAIAARASVMMLQESDVIPLNVVG